MTPGRPISSRICISLGPGGRTQLEAEADNARFAEIRFDLALTTGGCSPEESLSFIRCFGTVIAACRPGRLSASARETLLTAALDQGAAFVDVEADADAGMIQRIRRKVRSAGARLILSTHDFTGTPSQQVLDALFCRAIEAGADLVKIACLVSSADDEARLLGLLRQPGHAFAGRILPVALGKQWACSARAKALSLGAPFTYAAPDTGPQAVLNQPRRGEILAELHRLAADCRR